MNVSSKKNLKQNRTEQKKGKSSLPFAILFLVPLTLFLVTAIGGGLMKVDRMYSESSFEEKLNPLHKVWRGLQLKVFVKQHGIDFRNKISETERRSVGLYRESFLESLLPKFIFMGLIVLYPAYFFINLWKRSPKKVPVKKAKKLHSRK
ncbi:hypothetical protein CH373_08730 [Leptospira perolatii]|uniref:Uncharacterized protein n=1 Tax=Leptospira perolatii TaxID=2023191 RepID=A0A2M9ZNP7_9LEPT|nr:hypothetical protein CH360_09875 [Leptospira perolatii]PJZ73696.1 hypothetical protein CH373_08730 [Leptospira perolatii]